MRWTKVLSGHWRKRFARSCGGMAAAEFGLLLPLFLLAVMGMIDIGVAIHERMNLDQVLRSGAQLAMTRATDVTELQAVSFAADGFSDDESVIDDVGYSLAASKTCECAGTVVSCSTMCDNDDPPSIFYDLTASKLMQSIILPDFDVTSSFRVQIR